MKKNIGFFLILITFSLLLHFSGLFFLKYYLRNTILRHTGEINRHLDALTAKPLIRAAPFLIAMNQQVQEISDLISQHASVFSQKKVFSDKCGIILMNSSHNLLLSYPATIPMRGKNKDMCSASPGGIWENGDEKIFFTTREIRNIFGEITGYVTMTVPVAALIKIPPFFFTFDKTDNSKIISIDFSTGAKKPLPIFLKKGVLTASQPVSILPGMSVLAAIRFFIQYNSIGIIVLMISCQLLKRKIGLFPKKEKKRRKKNYKNEALNTEVNTDTDTISGQTRRDPVVPGYIVVKESELKGKIVYSPAVSVPNSVISAHGSALGKKTGLVTNTGIKKKIYYEGQFNTSRYGQN